VAYGWAFFNPVRKVYYNLAITGLSVFICFFIGTIEVLGLLPTELHLSGGFWNFMANFNINTAGFVIVGLFVATWLGALMIWKFGHVEERWTAKLAHQTSSDQFEEDLDVRYLADVADVAAQRVS
jgi:nickel/cobalt transporter (NiCoT) family protein